MRTYMHRPLLLLTCLLATACTVGPDYHVPETNFPSHWLSSSSQEDTTAPAEIAYWQQFHDPVLNALVEKAMANNLDLQIAQSRIDEARSQVEIADAALLPTGSLSGTAERQANRIAFPGPIDLSKPFNTFQTGFDASWELDLFGKSRREIESRTATLQASEASARDMRVSLLAEIARTYMDIRQYQAQAILAESTLATYEKGVSIAKQRFNSGEVAGINVTQAQALVEQAKTQRPYYQNLVAASQLSMDVLLGEQPGATRALTEKPAPIPAPAPELVLEAPAKAIADRPDIQIAERKLAAATAKQGVAVAQFFPDISLSGFLGLLNVNADSLAQGGSRSWSGRGNIALPILNYGELSANLSNAKASQREALATYRKSILLALSDVERAVDTYTRQQEYREDLQKTVAQNKKAATVARARYQAGLSSYLEVLDAERTLYASQTQSTEADARYAQSMVAVYKSLGGGWQADTKAPADNATPLQDNTKLKTPPEQSATASQENPAPFTSESPEPNFPGSTSTPHTELPTQ